MSDDTDGVDTSFRSQLRIRHWAALTAIGMSLYHLSVPVFGEPIAEVYRPTHAAFALTVIFAFSNEKRRSDAHILWRLWDFALIGLTILATGYLVLNVEYITTRLAYVTPLTGLENFLGTAMVVVLLEAARRTVGWALVLLTAIFILYAFLGNVLPDPFWHRGFTVSQILERLYLTLDGIWGVPLGVTASYVFLFVLFGAFLLTTGGGSFFNDLAHSLAGRAAGGPARTSVLASAFMGTLSGSTPANVVTTGSFTIPTMKSHGYPAHFAGGIEAAASTGGQLMPPIMGAAAFIMVEFTGIPYFSIISHALIPALLYFFAVYAMVSLEAQRLKLGGGEEGPKLLRVLRGRGYLLLPIIIMVAYLAMGYPPSRAAFWAIVVLLGLSFVLDHTNRAKFIDVLKEAMIQAPRIIGPVTVATACGGIITGVVIMTGMGQKMSTAVLALSGGYLLPTLLLTAVVAVLLGMGMPTSGAYIILAALLAPGIVELEVPLIAAHMFLLYSASMSSITPPVAIASYAAAGVADANPWKTSLAALRLSIGVFIIPFFFVYGPALLMVGAPLDIAYATLTAAIGIFFLAVAIVGWLWQPLSLPIRGLVAAAAISLVAPGWIGDTLGGLVLAAFLGWRWIRFRPSAQKA